MENFQPFYKFVPRYMDDLHIGAKILRDHLGLEMEKEERAARAKANEKANAAAAAERVKIHLAPVVFSLMPSSGEVGIYRRSAAKRNKG